MREVTLEKRIVALRTRPRRPETTSSIVRKLGTWRLRSASMATTPRSRAASKTPRASRSLDASAFSTSTCLPPAIIRSAWAACAPLGLATYTASTASLAASSERSSKNSVAP